MKTDLLTILCGDALEQLRTLPDESVQCCVTSPPYWGLRDYQVEGQLGLEKTPEQYVAKMVEVFCEVRRVLKRDGSMWLNLGDSYWTDSPVRSKASEAFSGKWDPAQTASRGGLRKTAAKSGVFKNKDLVGIPWMTAFALRADGWWLRSDIIWAKPNPMPESVTDRPTKSHEYLFLLTKSAKYYYDAEAIQERAVTNEDRPSGIIRDRILDYDSKEKQLRNRKSGDYGNGAGRNDGDNHPSGGWTDLEYRNKRSVWTVNSQPYADAHFATYPPDLIKPCILAGSKPGDIILDPFAGSGTTGMVSLELGRKVTLIELNPEYVKLIEQRCNTTPGLALT